jgi:hypothetical protein
MSPKLTARPTRERVDRGSPCMARIPREKVIQCGL